MNEITYTPIGYIRSPFDDTDEMPIQPAGARGVKGSVEIEKEYKDGLDDLEGFSHIILICHLHLSAGYELKVVPFMDEVTRGLFSTRAPRRPNPIGLSVVRLLKIEENILFIENVDMIDGTPVLDIKPYIPSVDAVENPVTGWIDELENGNFTRLSDDRFSKDG